MHPETKEQSKQWTSPGKGYGHRFWDLQGVIYIDYLEKGKTVTWLYYVELLGRFDVELQKKRPRLAKKNDNMALANTSAVATAKLVELGYELLPHPPYSPDLVPCDFFLFSNLKKSLAGQKFESNDKVIAATEAYFVDLQKICFSGGLKKLEHRWVKCFEINGYYVEK